MRKFLPLASAVFAPVLAAQNVSHAPPATPSDAQSQFVVGLDIEGRITGTFTGTSNDTETMISMETMACNPGSVWGVWEASPDPDHPLITQMYCRLHEGRFEQINDYSYGKHSFGSTNSNGCGTCVGNPPFNRLGVNCSDTYGAGLNWNRGDLGPLTEWNSFTGEWVFEGSHLDTGYPESPPDNAESAINPDDSKQFRCRIPQSKIGTPGASYFAMVHYLHKWEPEANRSNNMSSMPIDLTTNSATPTGALAFGSVLETRYTGARVESARNEVGGVAMDGRFYVGSHVTENQDGSFHYEYAVHNRDHHAGSVEFRVPMCSSATAFNFGMKDADLNGFDPSNDWTASQVGDTVVFSAPGGARPQGFNTIYNFWFDSFAGPGDGMVEMIGDLSRQNPGANPSVSVAADVPGTLPNVDLGGGCDSGQGLTLSGNGRASIPNPNFSITLGNVSAGTPVALHMNFNSASVNFQSCSILNPAIAIPGSVSQSSATWGLNIPNNPIFEGWNVFTQAAILDAPTGPLLGLVSLSNKLRIRVGNNISGCQ